MKPREKLVTAERTWEVKDKGPTGPLRFIFFSTKEGRKALAAAKGAKHGK